MLKYVIVGRIIVDHIRLFDGSYARDLLGGGGPQTALGARIWSDSVGFVGASGIDLEPEHIEKLNSLGVDTRGYAQRPDVPTLRTVMEYDADQRPIRTGIVNDPDDWRRFSEKPYALPPDYRSPTVIHLQTPYIHDERVIEALLALRSADVLFSVEPIMFHGWWQNNEEAFIRLFSQVDIVSPDWISASRVASSEDPRTVLATWSRFGPSVIAVRAGEKGSYLWGREQGDMWHLPPVPARVVDPTGAGNAYSGGLATGWGEHRELLMAGACAAISASFMLDTVGMPSFSPSLEKRARELLEPTLLSAIRL